MVGQFIITGYCPCEKCTGKDTDDPDYRQTATSTPTKPVFAQEGRTVAADWLLLPPGTKITIEGLPGTFTVEDRGGAIDGRELDLYFDQHQDALDWGRQKRNVWIVQEE